MGKLKKRMIQRLSISVSMTFIVTVIVIFAFGLALYSFARLYRSSMERNAITTSEQAIVQVQNIVGNYTKEMSDIMNLMHQNMIKSTDTRNMFINSIMMIRKDVVAIMIYDDEGSLQECWSGDYNIKKSIMTDLSYNKDSQGDTEITISSPHIESLLEDYYPWVVTISQNMLDEDGNQIQIAMDISFSSIASYVDDVGIGQHGYCFIVDSNGSIIYHPQQQLIYSGLKEENDGQLKEWKDGSYTENNIIYTVHSLKDCNWRIVGVSYVDEMVTNRVSNMFYLLVLVLSIVLITAIISGIVFSRLISAPANYLAKSMEAFEKDTEQFQFKPMSGSREITALSDSFDHMVVQIQELMEQVRQEELSLRKTELNALQAQINPHFLYNTLDSIAWMCEEERTAEAVEMVNALARLFRISISRGHELITLEKEVQHAESYLKIQKYRYKNKFHYVFNIEEKCLPYLCNKITLQPMIENAIYHGLEMVDEGEIEIGIHEQNDDILLYVKDNGIGMTEEKCREILQKEQGDRTGIGIKNVHDRIRIYFGEKYGLTIKSELDIGTTVEILIPKVTEEDYGK